MRDFLTRLLLALALTLLAFALSSSAHAQQADEDPAPATPEQHKRQASPQSPNAQQPQNAPEQPDQSKGPAGSADDETQDALAFTGRVIEERGALVLHDPVTKMSYQLDDPLKARLYVGKQVKIVGKLDMKKNTIEIDTVELVH